MRKIIVCLIFALCSAAFASSYAQKPAEQMKTIKKSAKTNRDIIWVEQIATSEESADNGAIMQLRDAVKEAANEHTIPAGKAVMKNPETVATVLRSSNENYFTTFMSVNFNDIIKSQSEVDAAVVQPVVDLSDEISSDEEDDAEPQQVAQQVAEQPVQQVVEQPVQQVAAQPVEEHIVLDEGVLDPELDEIIDEGYVANSQTAVTSGNSFENLTAKLSSAQSISECKSQLANAKNLHKINAYGTADNCRNPKVCYWVALKGSSIVVLGPQNSTGKRKNLTTGNTSDDLNNYQPQLWFRR